MSPLAAVLQPRMPRLRMKPTWSPVRAKRPPGIPRQRAIERDFGCLPRRDRWPSACRALSQGRLNAASPRARPAARAARCDGSVPRRRNSSHPRSRSHARARRGDRAGGAHPVEPFRAGTGARNCATRRRWSRRARPSPPRGWGRARAAIRRTSRRLRSASSTRRAAAGARCRCGYLHGAAAVCRDERCWRPRRERPGGVPSWSSDRPAGTCRSTTRCPRDRAQGSRGNRIPRSSAAARSRPRRPAHGRNGHPDRPRSPRVPD